MPFIDPNQDQINIKGSLEKSDEPNEEQKRRKLTSQDKETRGQVQSWLNATCRSITASPTNASERRGVSIASNANRIGVRSDSLDTMSSLEVQDISSSGPSECLTDEASEFLASRGIALESAEEYIARTHMVRGKVGKAEKKKGVRGKRIGMGRPPMSPRSLKRLENLRKKRCQEKKEEDFANGPRKHLYAEHLHILDDHTNVSDDEG
ncbi:hypothetical protein CBS101457_002458 [Exobasidium rhododendri]|nr:hypothetical protein CBS101457_002458 [Exobasidium rhododendri]